MNQPHALIVFLSSPVDCRDTGMSTMLLGAFAGLYAECSEVSMECAGWYQKQAQDLPPTHAEF